MQNRQKQSTFRQDRLSKQETFFGEIMPKSVLFKETLTGTDTAAARKNTSDGIGALGREAAEAV